MALTPTVHRPTRTIWWPELGLLSGFVVLTGALAAGQLLGVDLAVRDWCDAHQQGVVRTGAWALNVLGSATLLAPIAFVLAVVVAVRSRSVRPVLPVVTAVVAANLLIVPLKMLCDRAAPHSPAPDPVLIFHHPPGWSYPSGHVANAVYLYGALLVVVDALRPVPPAVRRHFAPRLYQLPSLSRKSASTPYGRSAGSWMNSTPLSTSSL
ncbi:MAG: hypothetical protein AUI14_18935 [Actinobacteria bacterium 13_2_20CM_2_71_6]|nr:MAG: hypothetical protein AUI14_18935 [Actinobacteria bacterium 13_2_20CM_2_71_6]